MTHPQETGTGFLVPVFGTGFWVVCHGLKAALLCGTYRTLGS